jgi:hypothetical protein
MVGCAAAVLGAVRRGFPLPQGEGQGEGAWCLDPGGFWCRGDLVTLTLSLSLRERAPFAEGFRRVEAGQA